MAKLTISDEILAELLLPGIRVSSLTLLAKPNGTQIEIEVFGPDVPECDRVGCVTTVSYDETVPRRVSRLIAV